jgi:hypothetical protein
MRVAGAATHLLLSLASDSRTCSLPTSRSAVLSSLTDKPTGCCSSALAAAAAAEAKAGARRWRRLGLGSGE